MSKFLLAVDGSEGSLRAVDYVAREFGGRGDLHVTLFHVLPPEPPPLWDDGHILTGEERDIRQRVVTAWLANQKGRAADVFERMSGRLRDAGMMDSQVAAKAVVESVDVAEAILEEAARERFDTVVLGRRGYSALERFMLGSVANKVVNHARNLTVCVVE